MYNESFWDKVGTFIFKAMFYIGIVVGVGSLIWFFIQSIWTGALFTAIGVIWCLNWLTKRMK